MNIKGKPEKLHMYVRKSINGWFQFRKGRYNIQLNGDSRKGGFWLKQYADRLGKTGFMQDFTEILSQIEKDNEELIARGEYPIAIFSLYISDEDKAI